MKWYLHIFHYNFFLFIIIYLYYKQEELSKLTEIKNSMVVFCMATYGEGDPTDNAQAFYDWLKSGDADLTGVNFAVSYIALLYLF